MLFPCDLSQTKTSQLSNIYSKTDLGRSFPHEVAENSLPNPKRKENTSIFLRIYFHQDKAQVKRRRQTISLGTLLTSVPSSRTSSKPSRKPACTSWLILIQKEPQLSPPDLLQSRHPHPCQKTDPHEYHPFPFQHQSHLWLHHHRSADHLRVTKLPYIPILIDG